MAFKPNPNKEALLKKVRTLQRRETRLLNQIEELKREGLNFARLAAAEDAKLKERIAELQGGQADRLIANLAPAVEYGYRAGEKGVDNLQMTLRKWGDSNCIPLSAPLLNSDAAERLRVALDDELEASLPNSGAALDDELERRAPPTPAFPWEIE